MPVKNRMSRAAYCDGLDEICDRYGVLPATKAEVVAMNAELDAFRDAAIIVESRPATPAAPPAAAAVSDAAVSQAVTKAIAEALTVRKASGTRVAEHTPRVVAPAAAAAPAEPATPPREMSNRELARATVADIDGAASPFFSDDRGPGRRSGVSPFMRAFSDA